MPVVIPAVVPTLLPAVKPSFQALLLQLQLELFNTFNACLAACDSITSCNSPSYNEITRLRSEYLDAAPAIAADPDSVVRIFDSGVSCTGTGYF
jgi:hypothetical protein